jgi:hypothetical protein
MYDFVVADATSEQVELPSLVACGALRGER